MAPSEGRLSRGLAWADRHLRRFRISTRLGLGFGTLIALLLLLIVLGLSTMRYINARMDYVLRVNTAKAWHANGVLDALHTIEQLTLLSIPAAEPATRPFEHIKLITAWATLRQAVTELERLETTDRGAQLIAELRRVMDTSLGLGAAGESAFVSVGTTEQALARIRPSLFQLKQVCAELLVHEKEKSDLQYRRAAESYAFARNAFMVIGGLVAFGGVGMAFCFIRSITRPILEGVAVANRLAKGDLSVEIQPGSQDEAGQLLAAMRDMAESLKQMKSLEEQLLQSQKLETVGRLAGGVAHDFNNILTVITAQAELGLQKLRNGSPVDGNFRAVMDAGFRAANLVGQLLAFSRRQPMEMRSVNVNELMLGLRKMVGRLIGEDVEVVTELGAEALTVQADPVQLEQVVLNLVVNARDAMPSGGRLTIETGQAVLDEAYAATHLDVPPGTYVVLSVSDTGVGMTAEVRERVFEPFFTTKEFGRGTGLGLSTVYGIIKQSGGHIQLYSEPGRGSTFRIYLPQVDASDARSDEVRRALPPRQGNEVVLVVEDEPQVRNVALKALRAHGYQVLEAAEGHDALRVEAAIPGPIHVLLTDVVMPRMNGPALAQEIRRRRPNIKVVYMSGYADAAVVNTGLLPRGAPFVQKPFTLIALAAKVREALDGSASAIHT